jgi:ribulose kinase
MPLITHYLRCAAAEEEATSQIDLHDFIPLPVGHLEEGGEAVNPGITHRHIQPPEAVECPRDQTIDVGRFCHITRQGEDSLGLSQQLSGSRQSILAAAHDAHEGSLGEEAPCSRVPDASARPGDDRDSAIEPSSHGPEGTLATGTKARSSTEDCSVGRAAGRTLHRRGRIGVDVGTVAIRAVVHDADDGSRLASAVQPLPPVVRGPARELDPTVAWEAFSRALADVSAQLETRRGPTTIDSVAVASTASTILVTSPHLVPRGRALMWSDHRAAAEAEVIRTTEHPFLRRMLGHVSPEWGLPKFLHIVRATAGRRSRPDRIVELLDWLNWRLCGRLVANAGIREWGWCADENGQIPRDLAESLGLLGELGRLPNEVAQTGAALGTMRADVVEQHPMLAGSQLVMGGMDSYLAALGQGVMVPGRLTLSFGSSSSFVVGSEAGDAAGRMFGPLSRILPGPQAYWHGGQSTAGLAVSWLLGILRRGRDELERDAQRVPAGSGGVLFRETLLDRRTPEPEAPLRAVWDGLALSHGPAHLYRSVLEGIAMGTRMAVERLHPMEIVISGGLASSPLFVEILADVLRSPILRLRYPQATALGAAFAGDAGGAAEVNEVIETVPPPGADYEESYSRYSRLHQLPAKLSVPYPGIAAVA